MRMLFGTDGIRGVAGDPPLDHSTVVAVGAALGRHLARAHASPQVIIGQDTRESSRWLEASITLGLEWAGAQVQSAASVVLVGTPAAIALDANNFNAPENGGVGGGRGIDCLVEDTGDMSNIPVDVAGDATKVVLLNGAVVVIEADITGAPITLGASDQVNLGEFIVQLKDPT